MGAFNLIVNENKIRFDFLRGQYSHNIRVQMNTLKEQMITDFRIIQYKEYLTLECYMCKTGHMYGWITSYKGATPDIRDFGEFDDYANRNVIYEYDIKFFNENEICEWNGAVSYMPSGNDAPVGLPSFF